MDHWDEILPGRVFHLQYEELVRDPEANIRRLLTHCGLEFEPACLSFHETKRPVRTASGAGVPTYVRHRGRLLETFRVGARAFETRTGRLPEALRWLGSMRPIYSHPIVLKHELLQ
jgi:hypothetical protein